MIFLFQSLFLEINDASSLLSMKSDFNSKFSMTIVNFYSLPELTGIRLKGYNFLIYDISIFGFSYYNELMLGIGKIFDKDYINFRFIPYFLFYNAGKIKSYGFTGEISLSIKYLNFEGGFKGRNIFYIYDDELTPTEEVFISYRLDNFLHNLIISYSFENTFNIMYGMEVNMHPLIVRLGFRTDPFLPAFGIGVLNDRMRFEFGFVSHPLLGFTQIFTFSFIK